VLNSVAEPHHIDAALASDKNFDAAPAPAPTMYSKPTLSKAQKLT
jgi:hypothetical protein